MKSWPAKADSEIGDTNKAASRKVLRVKRGTKRVRRRDRIGDIDISYRKVFEIMVFTNPQVTNSEIPMLSI
jgi:hypothetical protein